MDKVVLLDRDGTVIVEPSDGQVTGEDKVKFFPDSVSAPKRLSGAGFAVVFVTNQPVVARGFVSEDECERINAAVVDCLAEEAGINVLRTYICPHFADSGCECHKPNSGMILRAAEDFGLDLAKTFMVGDHRSDVLAGKNAGTRTIMVHTAGHAPDEAPEADSQARNLTEAVDQIIANS